MRKFVLFLLLSAISFSAFSSEVSEKIVKCRPSGRISDAGFHVDIKSEGSGLTYTFSQQTYSGPKVLKRKSVSIGALKTANACKLAVYSKDDKSSGPMFYIYKENSDAEWRLLGAGDSAAPPLICEIDSNYESYKCSEDAVFTPIGINP